MATLVTNDIWQVRIVSYVADQIAVNTLHYRVGATLGASVSDSRAVEDFDTMTTLAYKNLLSQDATLRGYSIQRISPLPKTLPVIRVNSAGPGLVASTVLPKQSTAVLAARTQFAGKNQRSRIFIPFPGEGDNDANGVPSANYVTRLNALGAIVYAPWTAVLNAGVDEAEMVPVVYHRASGTYDFITSWIGRSKWATQERRGDYGKQNQLPF